MDDFRGKICLIDGEYLAKCIGQDFLNRILIFEVEPNGLTFIREKDNGVEIYEQGKLTFDDVKHLLPKINRIDQLNKRFR